MLTAAVAAAGAFAATNIDDIFVLMLFFSQVGAGGLRRSDIYAGQYLGFVAIVAVSLLGFAAGLLLPRPWIGLLGFAPIAIGVRRALAGRRREDEEDEATGSARPAEPGRSGTLAALVRPQTLNVAAVTFANGGDNFGIYIPLFATMTPATIGLTVAVFFALVAVWCWLGSRLARVPAIGRTLRRYGGTIVPVVFVGLGIYILIETESYRLLGALGAAS